ncbi:hypothetical protein ACS0TY_014002 [Phlomoides rotata]
MRLFSFTLTGRANAWLYSINPAVGTWDEVSKRFLIKFYPPSKTVQAKNSIAQFRQGMNEELPQVWEWFCNLLITCPHHGFPQEQLMSFFYCGLTDQARLPLDACSEGSYWLKSVEEITHIMDGIASNSFQMKMDRGNHHGVAQVDESDAMKTMMMTLMEKFDAFSCSSPRETLPPLVQERHVQEQQGVQEVNFMGRQNFQGENYHQGKPNFQSQPQGQFPQNSQGMYNATSNFQGGSSSYNPNFKHHENFSYANQKAAVQFPLGFNPGAKPLNNEGRPSQDEAIEAMFKRMEEFMKNTSGQIKTLEHQMRQLASTMGEQHQKGKFPSTTETNPREHCKAIKLRSGTIYDGPSKPLDEEEKGEIEEEEEEELELAKEDEEDKGMGTESERKKE